MTSPTDVSPAAGDDAFHDLNSSIIKCTNSVFNFSATISLFSSQLARAEQSREGQRNRVLISFETSEIGNFCFSKEIPVFKKINLRRTIKLKNIPVAQM